MNLKQNLPKKAKDSIGCYFWHLSQYTKNFVLAGTESRLQSIGLYCLPNSLAPFCQDSKRQDIILRLENFPPKNAKINWKLITRLTNVRINPHSRKILQGDWAKFIRCGRWLVEGGSPQPTRRVSFRLTCSAKKALFPLPLALSFFAFTL